MKTGAFIVLPGMDGTDLLLSRFIRLVPPALSIRVIALPDNPQDDYDTLVDKILPELRHQPPVHLIAESFSGPLSILLADRYPELVERVTLIATFASSPIPFVARFFPWWCMVRMPLPRFVAQRYFAGNDQEMAASLVRASKHTSSATLATRIRLLKKVNVCKELARLQCPVQYIRPLGDRLVPKKCVQEIANVNDRVRISEVNGPHLIMQTRPKQVWATILNGMLDSAA